MKTTLIILILAIFCGLTLEAKGPKLIPKPAPKSSKTITKPTPIKPKIKVKVDKPKPTVKKKARVTKYRPTGNPMANGMMPKEGYVAVSDRSIKLGSLIWIGYKRYIVGDYTANWVHEKFRKEGYDLTVDIFTNDSVADCLNFGYQSQKIALLVKG